MKRLSLLLLFLAGLIAAIGCTPPAEENAEETKAEYVHEEYTLEQFMKTVNVGGGKFNHDETKLLIHSNESGIYNIYSIDIASGEKTQLTDSQDTTRAVDWITGRDAFLFTRDEGGNELNKLYMQDENGEVTKLTRGDNTREMFAGYNPAETDFFTMNNSRDPRFMDVYKWDLETLEPVLFYQNNDGLNVAAISNDESYIALSRTHNDFDSDMYLLNMAGNGEPVLLNDEEGKINFFADLFSLDGSTLYYLTDEGHDFLYLMSYDLATGEKAEVFRSDWGVGGINFSENGKYQIITTNEYAQLKLHVTNTETGEAVELKNLPAGEVRGLHFSKSENLAGFYIGSDVSPSNLFVYSMGDDSVNQLTNNLNPEIDSAKLPNAELIEMTARDGLQFSGYLYKPKLANADNKVPALLYIHGGPGGQSRPSYSAIRHFYANHGYAIFDLNYRGSGGFGRAFSMADDQKHGKEPLWDCVDAKNWLIDNCDWIDVDKIGIMGGSYGGYMTMAALAYTPEEFKVGVNIFGVTNWVRTLKSIPPWWESAKLGLYRELGDPNTQEAMLTEISPLFHADKITKPVIVLQGANDPRVLQVESDEMVANIRNAGGIAEYVLFPDEGHGFSKNANTIEGYNKVLVFLDKYLKGETFSEDAPEGQ